MSLLEQQELEQDAAAPAGLLPPAATPAHAGRAVRHRCVVDPDRQILGNAEVPGHGGRPVVGQNQHPRR